jgi:two-component system KDP operon response regulator KdpE
MTTSRSHSAFGSSSLESNVSCAVSDASAARLRSSSPETLKVDLTHRRVWSKGQEVHITAKPYEVLRTLVENAGKVVPHSEILEAVWGGDRRRGMGYLRLAIRELRRLLEPDPSHPTHILTETGVGYRLVSKCRPVRINIPRRRPKRRT